MLELVYSTNVHGISLKTLYRNFEDYDTTALLVVRDENDRVSVLLFGFQTCLKVWLTRSRLFPFHRTVMLIGCFSGKSFPYGCC